jgi:hypothetical protein
MRRWLGAAAIAALLGGCGGGVDPAVLACEKAIGEQLADRVFTLDRTDMGRKLARDGDRGQINSTVWFNKGLPNELAQTFSCQVLYDVANPKAEPAVTSLRFQW